MYKVVYSLFIYDSNKKIEGETSTEFYRYVLIQKVKIEVIFRHLKLGDSWTWSNINTTVFWTS